MQQAAFPVRAFTPIADALHAFLAPSSAARWVRCAYSATLEAMFPELEPSAESLEGTAAHWVVQMLLQGTAVPLNTITPQGVAVTLEMIEGAEAVLADVVATLGPRWREMLYVERRVQIKRVHPTHNWGTPDYFAWVQIATNVYRLYCWDYKFGHGIVEAFDNWQGIDYMVGIMDEAGVNTQQDQVYQFDFRVAQPRAYHRDGVIRSWRGLLSDLRGPANRLRAAAEDATSGKPTATPTAEGCKNCRGRHACEANQRAAYSAADRGKQGVALEMTPAAMGLELRVLKEAADLLKSRITGLEQEVVSTLQAGKVVPWWQFDTSPGKKVWKVSDAQVIIAGQLSGLDLAKPPEAITPTQAAAKGFTLHEVMSHRPKGGAKLVPDDGTKAARVFTQPT